MFSSRIFVQGGYRTTFGVWSRVSTKCAIQPVKSNIFSTFTVELTVGESCFGSSVERPPGMMEVIPTWVWGLIWQTRNLLNTLLTYDLNNPTFGFPLLAWHRYRKFQSKDSILRYSNKDHIRKKFNLLVFLIVRVLVPKTIVSMLSVLLLTWKKKNFYFKKWTWLLNKLRKDKLRQRLNKTTKMRYRRPFKKIYKNST